MQFKLKKGLDIPISGQPEALIENAQSVAHVAVLGCDFPGLKPTMLVKEGDRVLAGQTIFEDKKNPGIQFTAPASGVCININRGHKRVLQSVVIKKEGTEYKAFEHFLSKGAHEYDAQQVRDLLIESGAWVGFKTRPYSKVPAIGSVPKHIFVTAMDTNPLSASVSQVIEQYPDSFKEGLVALSRLAPVYVCKAWGDTIPQISDVSVDGRETGISGVSGIKVAEFSGPHPAGLAGTHMHFLAPASVNNVQWSIGYQEVIAIGYLFKTGRIWNERIISLAGPEVKKPRMLLVPLGASLSELTRGELTSNMIRVISGSILSGRTSSDVYDYLGRHHIQVSVLAEGKERGLFEYLWAGKTKHSALSIFISKLNSGLKLSLTTSTQGSPRAMVPVGAYEKVVPMDFLPTQLLRALIVGDLEMAEALGSLELDEEDLGLCTYVCPGKYEYGPLLRRHLEEMERET